jgi:uncharacterized protein YdhG (YjbR/CyaY superfamily)
MKTYASTEEHIRSFPASTRKVLKELRAAIHKAAPLASEKISYGIPTLFQNGNLVHYAAFENHIGLYGAPREPRTLDHKLQKYRTGKGTLRFALDQPLPLELVREIVKRRVEENTARPAKK